MSLVCMLCGATSDTELITHINSKHSLEGGYRDYADIFAGISVVSKEVYSAVYNEQLLGFKDDSVKELDSISGSDKKLLLESSKAHMPIRSEIIVTKD